MKFAVEWTGRPVKYRPAAILIQEGANIARYGVKISGAGKPVTDSAPADALEVLAAAANPYKKALGPIVEVNNYDGPEDLIRAIRAHLNRFWDIDTGELSKPLNSLA